MKSQQQNIFDDYGKPNQRSYPLKSFCSAALRSLKKYAEYEQEVVVADRIVAQETNPQTISKKLIAYFDITKEGEDQLSIAKRRKGQDYFRRMILANYGGRCALTGISVPQLLLAIHIIPWADKSHKKKTASIPVMASAFLLSMTKPSTRDSSPFRLMITPFSSLLLCENMGRKSISTGNLGASAANKKLPPKREYRFYPSARRPYCDKM